MPTKTNKPAVNTASLFMGGILRLVDAKPSKQIPPLWFGIYKGKVTLLNGETGAGKSSLFRLISHHAARNVPLWEVDFGLGRPLNVLYVDPENMGDASQGDGGLTADRMDALNMGRPANLFMHSGTLSNGEALNLSNPAHITELGAFIKSHNVDLVIIDPYAALFQLTSENDNAEASRNIFSLKDLARQTDCAIVLCHHTGKTGEENAANVKYGRGASALLAGVDVGITFRLRSSRSEETSDEEGKGGDSDRRDYVRLKIEKNRVGFGYSSLYLQMAGEGQFRRVSYAEFFKEGNPNGREAKKEAQEQESRRIFEDILKDFEEHGISELIDAARSRRISKQNASNALSEMVESGELSERRGERNKGWYRLTKGDRNFFSASASHDGVKYRGRWNQRQREAEEAATE